MNSNNTNHFGNPLVTNVVGNGNSNGGSSKQQYYNTTNNNKSSLQISPSTARSATSTRTSSIYLHHQFPESPRSAAIHHQLPTIVSPVPPYSRTNEKTREPVDVPTGKDSVSESSTESRQDSIHRHRRHPNPNHYPNKSFSHDSGSSSSRSLSIGLPSMYPANRHHTRNNSFESFLLEELQDFDEIFGGSFRSIPQQQQQQPNTQI